MSKKRLLPVAGCLVCCLIGQLSAQEDSEAPPANSVGRQLIEMIDVISEHHIDPPTRQQMVLDSLRRAASVRNRNLPPGLAREISTTAQDKLDGLLLRHLEKMSGPAPVMKILSRGVNFFKRPKHLQLSYIQPIPIAMTSREADRVNKQLAANRYVGIGIRLGMNKTGPFMQKVIAGGPAAKAGAKDQDVILEVDGVDTKGESIKRVVDMLRGPEGTNVEVVLRQPDEAQKRTYTMTRGVVPIPGVSPVAYSSDGRAAGIRIEQVTASTVHELRAKESELNSDVQVVALDVRYLSNHHLHYGKLLVSSLLDGCSAGTVETHSTQEQFIAEPGRLFTGRQLVLLIGPQTRGTLEWLAGAVQDQEQGILIGGATPGHGYCAETVSSESSDYVFNIPNVRLRRQAGQSLYSTLPNRTPHVHTMTVRPTEEAEQLLRLSKANRYLGPGVHPDVPMTAWQTRQHINNREAELKRTLDKVLQLLPDAAGTTESSAGD